MDVSAALRSLLVSVIHVSSALVYILLEVTTRWSSKIWNAFHERKPEDFLRKDMTSSRTYEEWREKAERLDSHCGNDAWKASPASQFYDYKLIHSRLQHLKEIRETDDVMSMIYLLRSGLLRNLGGICDTKLYYKSPLGTKQLIEDYMEEVVSQLGYIAGTDSSKLNPQVKVDFFNDTRQSFGCSALVLYGGATFGLYHIGVVKALNQHGLLPRIISGTAVGALIAALICIHTDDELPHIFRPEGINLKAFNKKGTKGNVSRKITRFLKHGYLMDIKVLEECVQANVGDLTFEEAYAKTKRILNISVSSTRKFEVPQLLNYLTAPNVLISSAACASTALMGLYDTVNLLAKDKNGKIVQWSPTTVKWTDASPAESESPLTRLAELFNVNHFIVSQANPYIVPFVPKGIRSPGEGILVKLAHVVTSEFRHRLFQLEQMHLLPRMLRGMADENVSGNVTIVPDLSVIDFQRLFSNPTHASLDYWILKGEQSAWPMLAMIRTRCMIELELDRILLNLKLNTPERATSSTRQRAVSTKKRTSSMH